jgi:DNA-binding transcriptional LysR family regulator
MVDHLRALAVFTKVMDGGSFRAAARTLGLSPSVVSHHVRELEARLGTPVLHRSTRQMSLTPAGERLLGYARQMVEAAERALDGVSSAGGKLRVTAPAFLASTGLCRDLAEFSALHPRVELRISFSETTHDLLRDGYDVALRMGKLEDSSYRSRRLGDLARVLVAAPAELARAPRLRVPSDLEGCRFIQLSSRPPLLSLASAGQKSVTLKISPHISVDNASAMRELVLAGAGFATLPMILVRDDLRRGRLRAVLPKWSATPVGVYAVWPNHAQRSKLTRAFVEFVEPRLASLLGEVIR